MNTNHALTEIIPRRSIPVTISSDNGAPFVNEAIAQLSALMGIDVRQHCAHHPASGGAVERENGTLKAKLAKCCEETGLPWTKALPTLDVHENAAKSQSKFMSI